MSAPPGGRLVVVGTGIRSVGQLTTEAIAWMKVADVVLHLVVDPVVEELLASWQTETHRTLRVHYADGRRRRDTYQDMTADIVAEVVAGRTVCVALYGHPGVFARPTHQAIRQLRELGYPAEMLPAVSAEDCLFADLGIDPGDGCQSFEATNFICFDHRADPTAHLVLWQIGSLGDWTYRAQRPRSPNLQVLVDKLATAYPLDHDLVLYEAAVTLGRPHRADHVPLAGLSDVPIAQGVTLYVPPAEPLRRDPTFYERVQRVE
jgi:uncharacterized protein YabN with tetrapyrrole methylase and pyrophosphatase domain